MNNNREHYNEKADTEVVVDGQPLGIAYVSGNTFNVLTDNGWRAASVRPVGDGDGAIVYKVKAPAI